MGGLNAIAVICGVLSAAASLSGQVLDTSGAPVVGAQVFLERDLASPIQSTQADASGRFRFDDVPPGRVGVVAIGDGTAFGGDTVTVSAGERHEGLLLRLRATDTISGVVTNHQGEPVEGARITRVAHLSEAKVAVPLAKLGPYGFETPRTDNRGRFTVSLVPQGADVALKISHPSYAQEGVPRVAAGARDVRVSMHPGVVLTGRVRSQDGNEPVPHAGILIRSAEPPHDTTVATTDGEGAFTVRLKPGVYAYQAASATLRSPGWDRLVITGETPQQRTVLSMAGVGALRGEVRNALTRDPVEGARLSLLTMGNPAEIVQTGSTGTYRLRASAGENVIRLESAPGYRMPEQQALRVQVTEGEDTELPIFWLVPNPAYRITVLDDQRPVPHAALRILRPEQFGWWKSDSNGRAHVEFTSLPADGVVVGWAEHPATPKGAVFILTDEDEEVSVSLSSYGKLVGSVRNTRGQGVEGAIVTAVLTESPGGMPIPLWQTVTQSNGAFVWDAMPAELSIRCVVTDPSGARGQSEPFLLAAGAEKELDPIVLQEGRSGDSMYGKSLRWDTMPVIAGDPPGRRAARQEAAAVLFVSPEEAAMVVESLAEIQRLLGSESLRFVVISEGPVTLDSLDASILVLQGSRPGLASTYLVAPGGSVVLETYGLPPLAALQNLEKSE